MKLTVKQKNCPYCHYPWKKIIVKSLEDDDETLCFERYETNEPYKLIKTVNILRNCDFEPWVIVVNNNPRHCEMCGRPLNEEEE